MASYSSSVRVVPAAQDGRVLVEGAVRVRVERGHEAADERDVNRRRDDHGVRLVGAVEQRREGHRQPRDLLRRVGDEQRDIRGPKVVANAAASAWIAATVCGAYTTSAAVRVQVHRVDARSVSAETPAKRSSGSTRRRISSSVWSSALTQTTTSKRRRSWADRNPRSGWTAMMPY